MVKIGSSDLEVSRLCLGANVFGWTADRASSFAVLDAYAAAGGNFVDTSDSYTWRVPGNSGGESETVFGDWMAARGNRDAMVVTTKVGSLPSRTGLSAATIRTAVEDSLRRLRTDRIDLYYAHGDDPDTAQEETLDAFDGLVRAGAVRAVGASNFTAGTGTPAHRRRAAAAVLRERLTCSCPRHLRVVVPGRATIPRQPGDRPGIAPDQELELSDEDSRLVARKGRDRSAVDAVYGILNLPVGTEAMIEEHRGPAELPFSPQASCSTSAG